MEGRVEDVRGVAVVGSESGEPEGGGAVAAAVWCIAEETEGGGGRGGVNGFAEEGGRRMEDVGDGVNIDGDEDGNNIEDGGESEDEEGASWQAAGVGGGG